MKEVNDTWLTLLTPNSQFIMFYWVVLFLLLVGQGVLLLTVRNSESMAMLTGGVGLKIVAINLIVSSSLAQTTARLRRRAKW